MIMPDFKEWADNLVEEYTKTNYSNCVVTVYNPSDVSHALKQAFEQGYHLGCREGYEEGLNRGWAIEQDKEYANKESDKA